MIALQLSSGTAFLSPHSRFRALVPSSTAEIILCSQESGFFVDVANDGGCMKQVLREPLASARRVEPGAIAILHFALSFANGTLIYDSRNVGPLDIRIGAEPSDAVRRSP